MKMNKGLAAGILILSGVVALSLSAQDPPGALSQKERMDKLFDFWNRLDQPGFAVVVVKEGQVVYQNVFGLAGQEHAVPIAPNTLFNTATLSQAFVGQAVAMLEKQGRLSLDDDVRKYVPELPDLGTPVKLRHLVYQTSGLRDWLSVLQLAGRDRAEVTIDTVLSVVKAQKRPLFPPGDRTQYTDTNYDLLAEVIKRAVKQPFSDWAWENILKPLKMTQSQFRENSRSVLDNQAMSYNFTRREYLRGIDNLSLVGSHSLFSSVAELAKWILNFETGQVGGPESIAKMTTAGILNDGKSSGSTYGLRVMNLRGRRCVSLTGTWAGSGADFKYFPDDRLGFVVLANWDYTGIDGFGPDIAEIYLPAPAPPAGAKPAAPATKAPAAAGKTVKVSPKTLELYDGDYRLGPGQVIAISHAGGQLYLAVPGQKFALTALSETEFFLDVAQGKLTFQKNKDGRVAQFLWNQGGEEVVAPRIILVKPTPQELQEFAGSYVNDELNVRFGVEPRGTGLALLMPGQPEIRLGPDEKDRFAGGPAAVPTIVFQRDAEGRVTGFVIDRDSVRDLVFKKS
ncbi:MAG TPA: serine hydrolase [Acidobacteriota bacterium]|nr:serine hydrolase [Acidobacteriota bacterium]